MATDGTKIIDGDTAHDTYQGIMDLFDSGATFEMIQKEFPLENEEYKFDDFDYEIYVTSCGLAYWQIGLMSIEKLEYIKEIINKNACVKVWSEYSEKEGKSRKTVLEKYLLKIEKVNEKVRKTKKYKKITNFIFDENSVLTLQLSSGEYAALLCSKIDQYRGKCYYDFTPFTYKSTTKPTIEDIEKSEILGGFVGRFDSDEKALKNFQKGIEKIWEIIENSSSKSFGLNLHKVEHKDLLKFKDNFEKIGELNLRENFNEPKSLGYNGSFEDFDQFFIELDKKIKTFRYNKIPVRLIIEA